VAVSEEAISARFKAKRVRAYAGVRTSAFHARWGELDLRAVGEAVTGIRELVEHYLSA
jgi:hypothetical protein